ncbi:hypothetical protein AvCA_00310 [Azotobacter vinelandii CA]|uniref:Uncharacterized protein n=2 Tax=Azotobacter vinelandii TaxID=354 RepID=C1DFX1_AZOVD|nr:hypothetical protein Avin_00310 [Azotobacter vinelandii DJ]AGK17462.1 hypothetical protein AvCA_00310 [Azotobacter vinelandii CA]AGK19014.1 hypothetical protein AvCA6_00310 [Azotobacter vinelandii CA6]
MPERPRRRCPYRYGLPSGQEHSLAMGRTPQGRTVAHEHRTHRPGEESP